MTKKSILLLPLLASILVIAVGLVSCEELSENRQREIPGVGQLATEVTDEYSVSYKYRDSVIVLTDERLVYLEKVENDTVLYFSTMTPSSFLPDVGDVVTARSTDKTPRGLGNVVIERTKVGNWYRCLTTSTPIDNVFEELDFTYHSSSLIPDTLTCFIDEEGNVHEIELEDYVEEDGDVNMYYSPGCGPNRVTVKNSKICSFKAEKKFQDNSKIEGQISFGIAATATFSLKNRICEFSFEPILNVKAGVEIKNEVKQNWTYSGIRQLQLDRMEIGPIVFNPIFDLELKGEVSVKGALSWEYKHNLACKIGFNQDGLIWQNKSKNSDKSFFERFKVDAVVTMKPIIFKPIIKVSEFTNTESDEISLSAGPVFKVDFDLSDDNLFRNNPELEIDLLGEQKTKVNFNVEIWKKKYNIFSFNKTIGVSLFNAKLPLLPGLVEESLSVERVQDKDPLTFNSKYTLTGGLLEGFYDLKPGIRIYRGNKEVYHLFSSEQVNYLSQKTFNYQLRDLEEDVVYTAKPCISIDGVIYDEDGKSFSAMSPTAAITDIVFQGSEYGNFLAPNGHYYSYKYYHYVNADLIGAELCSEWGLYVPNAMSGKYYNPFPDMGEGIHTQNWTLYANVSPASTSFTPYVKHLKDGHYQLFETNTATFTHRGGSGAPARAAAPNVNRHRRVVNRIIQIPDGVLVLESIER